jgi:hypothetical protein
MSHKGPAAITPRRLYTWLRKNRPAEIVSMDDVETMENVDESFGRAQAATPEAALMVKADATRLQSAIMSLPTAFRESRRSRPSAGASRLGAVMSDLHVRCRGRAVFKHG